MAAFVGYCVQANGFYFPWRLTGGPNPIMHADISAAGSPAEQWDALPIEAKYQIIVRRIPLFIAPICHPLVITPSRPSSRSSCTALRSNPSLPQPEDGPSTHTRGGPALDRAPSVSSLTLTLTLTQP